MMIRNREAERVQSKATPKDLVDAMAALDLQSIPPHLRPLAIQEQLAKVMLHSTTDPVQRAKPAFQAAASEYMRRKAEPTTTPGGIILPGH